MTNTNSTTLFIECCKAMESGQLINRESRSDKEFHFQNWIKQRLTNAGLNYDNPGRNSYPDFTLVNSPEGFEVKGLGWPGREANYDSNSRVPSGLCNGRTVYYVFGRYPSDAEENEYPVIDLVICHGDFLNADHDYIHENKSFKGFGSYGDILVRDRKMYVAPTPFALLKGATGQKTLILPEKVTVTGLVCVGEITRIETADIIVGYEFDLKTNKLTPKKVPNPNAGKEHKFWAYREQENRGPDIVLNDNKPVQL